VKPMNSGLKGLVELYTKITLSFGMVVLFCWLEFQGTVRAFLVRHIPESGSTLPWDAIDNATVVFFYLGPPLIVYLIYRVIKWKWE
jgi:hypothetical protein